MEDAEEYNSDEDNENAALNKFKYERLDTLIAPQLEKQNSYDAFRFNVTKTELFFYLSW